MMNTDMTNAPSAVLGENLAFLAFPAKRSSEQISSTTDELVRLVSSLISQVIGDLILCRSRIEFQEARQKQFGKYMQLMTALGDLVSASVDIATIDRLTHEALYEMEEQFREEGSVFGSEIADQAQFTSWTLGKIHVLVQECNAKKAPGNMEEADLAFAREYVTHVLFARFHLDCLRMSLVSGQPLFPEVLEEISEGLRATVDAYAWVRQGRDLRHSRDKELSFEMDWDEDQQELLNLSTSEMMRENY